MNAHRFASLLSFLFLTGCNAIPVNGTGQPYAVTHELNDLNTISVSSIGELRIQNSKHPRLEVMAQQEIHEKLSVQQTGKTLVIKPEEGYRLKTQKTLRYTLYTDGLTDIKLSGSTLLTSDEYHTESLTVQASGNSDIDVSIYGDVLAIKASGALEGYLTGNVKSTTYKLSGASNIHAYDLNAENADINISGAGTVFVTATKTLDVSATGASTVRYKGTPQINQSTTGASSIKRAEK